MKVFGFLVAQIFAQEGSGDNDDSGCPNESWEFDGASCVPKASEYSLTCDPINGMTLSVNSGVLWENARIQSDYKGSFLRIGMCGGRRDENGPFDFTINAAWDYCGPSTVYHDENSGEIVLSFTVLGDIDAITNDDGLLMSRALSFQAECAFKDHLEVSETFTADLGGMMRRTKSGAVRKGDQSFVDLFSLNFYENEEFSVALEQPKGIIGFPAFAQVNAQPLPSSVDYQISKCIVNGLDDSFEEVSYEVVQESCASAFVDAQIHKNGKALSYDVFAFGESPAAMSQWLTCTVKLCADECPEREDSPCSYE